MDELAACAVNNNDVFAHFGSEFTPIDVREKIATVAKKTMASARAPEFETQTGAAVYWQNPEEAAAQFEADIIVMGTMAEIEKAGTRLLVIWNVQSRTRNLDPKWRWVSRC